MEHQASAAKQAVVIGGSLGGLFAGLLLRSIGWDVDIYEHKRPGPPFVIEGEEEGGRRSSMGCAPKARFAVDSPVEGDGFELPVPREKKSRNLAIPSEFN